jgi:hypothetical protein
MPKFDAGEVYSALDYDFTKAGVPDKGRVPEPTDAMIGKFLSGLKSLVESIQDSAHLGEVDTDNPLAVLEALNSLDAETFVDALQKMAEHYAELTRGQPSLETLLALPLRVRQAFYAWIQTEVISPEAAPGATSQPGKTQLSAVAG